MLIKKEYNLWVSKDHNWKHCYNTLNKEMLRFKWTVKKPQAPKS